MICIGCPMGCLLTVDKAEDGSPLIRGNTCDKGAQYGRSEMTLTKRSVTSYIRVKDGNYKVVSVKTAGEIPKEKIRDC